MVEHNVIIETAIKILNKHAKSIMLNFFVNFSDFMLVNGGDK